MLISVVVLAVAIIGVALTSQGTPQQIPALDAVISNYGNQIQIYHNGGETLQSNEIEILVDGNLQTFKKGGTDASWTFWSPGESLIADVSSVPNTVRIVYKGPSGSKATLATADFSPSGMSNPGPISTDTLHAAFSSSPSSGTPPLVVQFTDLSTGSPVGYNWAFGDGGPSTRQNPTHVFGSSGTYTVSLTVTNSTGATSSVTHPITVSTSPPTPSGISPGQGTQGSTVPINVFGTGFASGAAIKLKRSGSTDIAASSVVFVSSTKLTGMVSIPAGAAVGSWDVVITNPDSQIGTLSNGFAVTTTSGPGVSAITPDNSVRTTPVTVIVAGSNFNTGATLMLKRAGSSDIVATGVNVVSSNMITGNFNLATATYGQWDVVVTNTDGQPGTLTNGFRVNAPIPTFTGISPAGGLVAGGTPVTLTGTNLSEVSSVTFGGTQNTTPMTATATSITLTSPAHAPGTFDVVITTPGGTATRTNAFTYYPVPVVTGIDSPSPAIGPNAGGTSVSISGSGFTGATSVSFGSVQNTTPMTVTDTLITVASPPHVVGTYDITVTTPGGTSATSPADRFGFYIIQYFTTVSTTSWSVPANVNTVEYLVVSGGGGGGRYGGGGGAGGVQTGTLTGLSGPYSVTVGAGGTAGPNSGTGQGGNGGSSSFGAVSATGGGGGGSRRVNTALNWNGNPGGAGGGAVGLGSYGTGTVGQGNNGGSGNTVTGYYGGGGGGSGGTGRNAAGTICGNGGAGYTSSITGLTYAGGGGGGGYTGGTIGNGGSGGGGNGAVGSTAGSSGTANTGGGGGGGGSSGNGGAGGSGTVIIKYY